MTTDLRALPDHPPVPRSFRVSLFESALDTAPKAAVWMWPKMSSCFREHIEAAQKGGAKLWSPATFRAGGKRRDDDVESIGVLVFDIDQGMTREQASTWLGAQQFPSLLHTTHSHTAEAHKFRVIIPLETDVSASDWRDFYRHALERIGGRNFDPSCVNPSRMFYMPSHPPGGEHHAEVFNEWAPAFLDPSLLLESARSARQKKSVATVMPSPVPATHRYIQKAIDDELQVLARVQPGEQDNALNRSAFNMGSLLAGAGQLELQGEIERRMVYVAVAWPYSREPWTERGATKTIRSGFEAGIRQPRDLRHLDDGDGERGHHRLQAADTDHHEGEPQGVADGSRYAAVVDVFQRWLYLPDTRVLAAVLGCVAANLAEGDPVWLMIIAPPASGKTEVLQSLSGLPFVHSAATMTEAALLSGTKRGEKSPDAKGGLLKEIGEFGILLLKDFTSILSQNRDSRASLLAALREIYDGSWTRHVGVDGGRSLAWSGKLGVVAASTQTIDGHHAVMSSMGERFCFFRMPEAEAKQQARCALSHRGKESQMRKEMGTVVAALFASPLPVPTLDDTLQERLIDLATLAVRCRSAVERDGRDREIDLIPAPEAPGRMALSLLRLHVGMLSIGVPPAVAWNVTVKTALDCAPALRWSVIAFMLSSPHRGYGTSEIAMNLGYPTGTTRRCLEDLAAHQLIVREKVGSAESARDSWTVSEFTLPLWLSIHATSDISGTPPVQSQTVPEMLEDPKNPPDEQGLLYLSSLPKKTFRERPMERTA